MFKSANFIKSYQKTEFLGFIEDAVIKFKKSSDYNFMLEYTVVYDSECNTFDIYLLN